MFGTPSPVGGLKVEESVEGAWPSETLTLLRVLSQKEWQNLAKSMKPIIPHPVPTKEMPMEVLMRLVISQWMGLLMELPMRQLA